MILNPFEIQRHQKNICRIVLQSEIQKYIQEIQLKNKEIDELKKKTEELSIQISSIQDQSNPFSISFVDPSIIEQALLWI